MTRGLGYRPLEGERSLHRCPWLPLVRHEWDSLLRTRWGVAVLLLCLLPAFGRLVWLTLLHGFLQLGDAVRTRMQSQAAGELAWNPDQVNFYVEPVLSVMPGMAFFLLLTSVGAARSVARDRASNALELYWTRSITPVGYLCGKWLGASMVVGAITIVAPMLLWGLAVLMADDWSRLQETALPMLIATASLTLFTLVLVGAAVLLSALPRTPNAALVAWAGLLVGSKAVGVVFARALQWPALRTLSVWDAASALVRAASGLPERGTSLFGAAMVLAMLLLVLGLFAARRLRLQDALA